MNTPKPQRPRRTGPVLLREEERCRLLFGPYEPPVVKRGFLVDEVRGQVPFGYFTNALIPWPKARRSGKSGSGGHVLCGDLLRALAHESGPAICHYWGVSHSTVVNWRRLLGLVSHTQRTEGAQRLVKLGVELAKLPQSREKLAQAHRGLVLSARHKARFHSAMHQGWRQRFKARRAAYQKTGRFPQATKSDPWIPEEEKLLSQLPTGELVRVLGRSTRSIQARRSLQGIRIRRPWVEKLWEPHELRWLGTDSDRVIAARLGRTLFSIGNKRRKLSIPAATCPYWTAAEEALVGKLSDAEVARRLGRTAKAVLHRRIKLGMALFHMKNRRSWSAEEVALLGTDVDAKIAKKLGRSLQSVALKRRVMKIPVKPVLRPWTPEDLAVLGTMSDIEAARKLGRTVLSISNQRFKCGIKAGFNRRWTAAEEKLLGTMSDQAVARKLGREVGTVQGRRNRLRIPIYSTSRP